MINLTTKCDEITNQIELLGENVIVDGIVNIEKYTNSSLKILWILKEPNSSDSKWSYQDYLSITEIERKIGSQQNTLTYRPFQKILYTSYGIISNMKYALIPTITEKDVYSIGEQIAYINIKKTGGSSSSKYREIQNAFEENKEILLRQISEYDPNIIIFGNTLNYIGKNDLTRIGWNLNDDDSFYADDKTKSTRFYNVSHDKLCIHAYHPSYWKIKNSIYCSEIIEGVEKWRNSIVK